MAIEGLKFEIKAEDLHSHLLARAAHHRARAEVYAARIREDRDAGEFEKDVSRDSVTRNRMKRDQHEASFKTFNWWADHVIQGETYILSDYDAQKLEFIPR